MYSLSDYEWRKIWSALTSKEFSQFIAGTILSVITSIIAAFTYTTLQNRENKLDISLISSLARVDLMEQVFDDLFHYDGKYLAEYHINISLVPSDLPGVMVCQLNYSYYTHRSTRTLNFLIVRNGRDDANGRSIELPGEKDRGGLTENYSNYELFYNFDERDLLKIATEEQLRHIYKIRAIVVNKNLQLIPVPSDELLRYTVVLPASIEIPGRIHLSYTVEIPLELSSFITVSFVYPTFGLECKFDYSRVADLIDIVASDFLSTKDLSNPVYGKEGEITFHHDKWIMPRSGIVFSWWKK